MHTDWNFVLNVLLLVGVVVTIWRIITGKPIKKNDEVNTTDFSEEKDPEPVTKENKSTEEPIRSLKSTIVIFLLAKEERKFKGLDLLHTCMASGLRFGEGQIFHRYQNNGNGPIMCSLAAATPTGTFDIQNINDFSIHGLCLFMEPSGNVAIDTERFEVMHKTAKLLQNELDAYILDDHKQPLSEISINRYYQKIAV